MNGSNFYLLLIKYGGLFIVSGKLKLQFWCKEISLIRLIKHNRKCTLKFFGQVAVSKEI